MALMKASETGWIGTLGGFWIRFSACSRKDCSTMSTQSRKSSPTERMSSIDRYGIFKLQSLAYGSTRRREPQNEVYTR